MSPEDALTQALASLDGQDATKGHRLRAVRIINQLTDRGFNVVATGTLTPAAEAAHQKAAA